MPVGLGHQRDSLRLVLVVREGYCVAEMVIAVWVLELTGRAVVNEITG